MCFEKINDSGFFRVNLSCQNLLADVITFRRDTYTKNDSDSSKTYYFDELRAYQCLLLLESPGITATWTIGHTQATETGSVNNLLSNYGNRSPNIDRNPYTDATYTNLASYGSCYKAECNGCGDTKFSLTVTFSEPVYLHALLMVLDTANVGTVNSFDIYGIAEDGTETNCGTYVTTLIYGFEAWCNIEVKSFRIEGTPANSANWEVTICSLGPMGSIYEHQIPVPASISFQQGQQVAPLTIDFIVPRTGFEIANVLDINLRQKVGSELPWVTLNNGPTSATVSFDLNPTGCVQELILESYDQNSPLATPAALKTDVIAVPFDFIANQHAFDCGQLSAAGQINKISENYEVHFGNKDVTLPVINHLPSFTISQELQSGVLTFSDGSTQNISVGENTALAAIGVTIETSGSQATLKVDVNDEAYYGSTLSFKIKDTVVAETTWSNTT